MPKQKLTLICLAVLAGLAAGSYQPLRRLLEHDISPDTAGSGVDSSVPAIPQEERGPATAAQREADKIRPVRSDNQVTAQEDSVVMVSNDLSLVRMAENGQFVGYKVLKNVSDPRFAAGDVITEINSEPVEDSAAGTELLTIGLMNPDAEISITRAQP